MIVDVSRNKESLCREILSELPAWFGISQAIEEYARAAEAEHMIGVGVDGTIAGFAILRHTSHAASEIHVIAVRRAHHRTGIGRRLVDAAAAWARSHGRRYLTVKTIASSHPSPEYACTRRFYEALGFVALEEFSGLWDGNPCLFMLKVLP